MSTQYNFSSAPANLPQACHRNLFPADKWSPEWWNKSSEMWAVLLLATAILQRTRKKSVFCRRWSNIGRKYTYNWFRTNSWKSCWRLKLSVYKNSSAAWKSGFKIGSWSSSSSWICANSSLFSPEKSNFKYRKPAISKYARSAVLAVSKIWEKSLAYSTISKKTIVWGILSTD